MPALFIVLPYYNSSNSSSDLDRTIQSLMCELHMDWCLIIVDDGSPFTTNIAKYGLDERIVYLRQFVNNGIETALNLGFAHALSLGAEYIARIDAGDQFVNNRLSKQLAILVSDLNISIVTSYADVVDREGNLLYVHQLPADFNALCRGMHIQNCIIHSSIMMRASILSSIDWYKLNFKAAEDYEFFFRIMLSGYKVFILNEVLTRYEIDFSGISSQRRRQQLNSTFRVQLKYFDFTQWRSYYGILRTSLLFLVSRKRALQLKKALS